MRAGVGGSWEHTHRNRWAQSGTMLNRAQGSMIGDGLTKGAPKEAPWASPHKDSVSIESALSYELRLVAPAPCSSSTWNAPSTFWHLSKREQQEEASGLRLRDPRRAKSPDVLLPGQLLPPTLAHLRQQGMPPAQCPVHILHPLRAAIAGGNRSGIGLRGWGMNRQLQAFPIAGRVPLTCRG